MGDELLRPSQVAELLDVSMSCLSEWRRTGRGPKPLTKPEGTRWVRDRRSDVDAWIKRGAA